MFGWLCDWCGALWTSGLFVINRLADRRGAGAVRVRIGGRKSVRSALTHRRSAVNDEQQQQGELGHDETLADRGCDESGHDE
jgi:hypothetical protein